MEENLCPKFLMIFYMNVESNHKKVHLTHHNKMELQNEPIEPSWSVREAWFLHKDLSWNFGLSWWTLLFTSKINAQLKLLIQKPRKKHGLVQNPMYLIKGFLL